MSDANGHITIANTISNIYTILTFNRDLKVTEAWMDANIVVNSTNFPDGSGAYMVFIDATSLNNATDLWPSMYTGVMTIYTNSTNATGNDEVILHCSGHASVKRLFLRTKQQSSSNYKIQIAASSAFSTAKRLVFKFRKLI